MADYYDNNKRTVANTPDYFLSENAEPHFPSEGLFIGRLYGPKLEIPALVDLQEQPNICFLYNSDENRERVNSCIERLIWRISTTINPKLLNLLIYNGGLHNTSHDSFLLLNDYLFKEGSSKVYVGSPSIKFVEILDIINDSVITRLSSIKTARKKNLVELNESLGADAAIPYHFLFLTDFPVGLSIDTIEKLSNIFNVGAQAGIYVIMSWDMTAEIDNKHFSANKFNPKTLFEKMELIFPSDNRFYFRNSGHDDVLNKFLFEVDDKQIDEVEIKKCSAYIEKNIKEAKAIKKLDVIKQNYDRMNDQTYDSNILEFCVPIGKDIISKQEITLKFNTVDCLHTFILGQSGSGKSVLLHNIITSAILKYSPSDLVLYLMDFKGNEFNSYRGVKHTKAVLVDNNDPLITLEILRELKEENKRRNKIYQQENLKNIDGYNKKHPTQTHPLILLIADECQVLFQTPRSIGVQMEIHREITDILNLIATQGRSQGIHMLLATQQLDETDISELILKNLTDCFLLMSAPSDSNRLIPDSSDMTSIQPTGLACYYHKKKYVSQIQTYYADDEELERAISMAQNKACDYSGNGCAYFCGSTLFKLSDSELSILSNTNIKYPTTIVGKNIGLKASNTIIELKDDYYENVLFFGVNKEDQTVNVLMNALIGLAISNKALNNINDFIVIDCLSNSESIYKAILEDMNDKGLCHLVERQHSGKTFLSIADDIQKGCAKPLIISIIGSERFIEVKRNTIISTTTPESVDSIRALSFSDPFKTSTGGKDLSSMTFQQILTYILDEGPMQGVHTLLQVDKPGNILFEGDYGLNATDKFKHKIILRSENKYLAPLRLGYDVDVENLSDEEEHLRAYYCQEGNNPMLFTPFLLPDDNVINIIKTK